MSRIRSWRIAEQGLTEESLLGYWSADLEVSFAVGTKGTILQTVDGGASWHQMETPDTTHLVSIWGFSRSDVYTVGNDGAAWHFDGHGLEQPCTPDRTALCSTCGGSRRMRSTRWATESRSGMTAPTGIRCPVQKNAELWAVWGSDPAHVFASGQNGVLIQSGRNPVDPLVSPTNLLLLGLWGTGPENVFAVGIQGTVLRWNGTEWNRMSTPSRQDLFAVWGKSGAEILAVGNNGAMLLYNGTDWNLLPQTATGENLRAVHAGAGWAVRGGRMERDGDPAYHLRHAGALAPRPRCCSTPRGFPAIP